MTQQKSPWISIKNHKPEEKKIFYGCLMIGENQFYHRLVVREGNIYYDQFYNEINPKEITHYQYVKEEETNSSTTSFQRHGL